MRTSAACRAFIQSFESCRLAAYRDARGIWTIGWGHTGPDVMPSAKWPQARADAAFLADVDLAENAVRNLITTTLTQTQFDALVSFAFNCGPENLQISTLRRRVNLRDFTGAAREFGRWNHITDPLTGKLKVEAGLTRRRAAEATLFAYDPADGTDAALLYTLN